MTRKEAMLIVIRAAQKYQSYLDSKYVGELPDHAKMFLEELKRALPIVIHK